MGEKFYQCLESEAIHNGWKKGCLWHSSTQHRSQIPGCKDFKNEESLLQSMGRTMGRLVDWTPKCHCELADEGIKYSWGCTKNLYHQQPLREKRWKEAFKMTVRNCLLRNNLTTEHVRSFSRHARQYILAYLAMQQVNDQQSSMDTQASPSGQIMPAKIEQLVKEFKSCHCAMDFDCGFIDAVFIKKEEEE